jgi:hypothetical protein
LTSSAVSRSITSSGRPVHGAQHRLGTVRRHAEHDAVGGQAVLHGEPLAQELRIPGQVDLVAGRGERAHPGHHLPRRPDRHGRLPHDQARRRQVRGERLGRGVDRAKVSPAGLALGRAHAQEVHLAELADLGERQGEPEPARVQVLPQQRLEAGLEERGLAVRGHRDLFRVDVDRQHLVAEVGQTDGVGEAEVSGPDDGDPRQLTLLLVGCSQSILTHQRL